MKSDKFYKNVCKIGIGFGVVVLLLGALFLLFQLMTTNQNPVKKSEPNRVECDSLEKVQKKSNILKSKPEIGIDSIIFKNKVQ